MNPRINVTRAGEERSVTCKPADMVRLEREYGIPVSALVDQQRMEWLCFLAWSAERRESGVTVEFESYLEDVDEVRISWGGDPPLGQTA